MSALAPPRALAPDLWVVYRNFGWLGLDIGGCMTIVRLAGGGLLVHSPVVADDATFAAVEALGEPVRHLVAPSKAHHLHVGDWAKRHPDAAVWGAPGLEKKRPDVRFTGRLGDEPPAEWGPGFATHVLDGLPGFREVAFLHQPSRTLVLADHLFRFDGSAPLLTRLLARVIGAYERAAFMDVPLPGTWLVHDRAALRASIDHVLGWDFDRIVCAHASVVETGGREVLRAAYRWLKAPG